MAEQPTLDPSLSSQKASEGSPLLKNLTSLSVAKQVSLVIALAASVALAVGIILWSQSTNYTLLFGSMDAKDMSEVIQTLDQENVPYKIEEGSGAILVPNEMVHSLRLKLAAQGYPKQRRRVISYWTLTKALGFRNSRKPRNINGRWKANWRNRCRPSIR